MLGLPPYVYILWVLATSSATFNVFDGPMDREDPYADEYVPPEQRPQKRARVSGEMREFLAVPGTTRSRADILSAARAQRRLVHPPKAVALAVVQAAAAEVMVHQLNETNPFPAINEGLSQLVKTNSYVCQMDKTIRFRNKWLLLAHVKTFVTVGPKDPTMTFNVSAHT